MKPVQWIIAVVVLVVMVFAVTFIMNFLGEDKNTPIGPKDKPTDPMVGESALRFSEPKYPMWAPGFVDLEVDNADRQHNFLFFNPSDDDVQVGLEGKNCKCASVSVVLASEEWKKRFALLIANELVISYVQPALNPSLGTTLTPWLIPGFGRLEKDDPMLSEAVAKIEPLAHLEVGKGADQTKCTVPPHGVGWVRLSWEKKPLGSTSISAELSTLQKNKQGKARLETAIRVVEPVRFEKTILDDQNLTLEDLQRKPQQYLFTFFSTTRTQLHPKATLLIPPHWKPEQSYVTVGEPKPLPSDQWPALVKRLEAAKTTPTTEVLKCAYQVPVTLHERSADKEHPFPFGPYRVRVKVTFDDPNLEPVIGYVQGKLTGDVRIAWGTEERIYLGHFPASSGSSTEMVMLYSEVPDLKLDIDRERTPAFLSAKLIKSPKDKTAWKLTAWVDPKKLTGSFPRQDDENLYDSAVYIKTGDSSRSLRIPVYGVADN